MINGLAQSLLTLDSLRELHQSSFLERNLLVEEYSNKYSVPIVQNTIDGGHRLLVDVVDGLPIYLTTLNSEAALTTGISKIQGGALGLNLEGDGMLIGVWDGGSVKGHIELDNRVISKEVSSDDSHATHVTGTLIASGINTLAKGMAPRASVTNWYFDNDLAEMTALAKPDETSLLLSNHSYGTVTGWTKVNNVWDWTGNANVSSDEDYRFGFYGSKAAALDQLAYLAPYYSIVWAAGNDRGEPGDGSRPPDCNGGTGYDCIIPESVAKNIITVGAVNKVANYTNPSSVAMSSFSSWGPTDDGRIKPDIVGAGVNLFSLSAVGTDTYEYRSGTSMATPNVTGSLALLQELRAKLHGGEFMKAATLKALSIHTAKEAGILPGPDYSFGWGLLDVEAAAKLLVNEDGSNNIVEEAVLLNGSRYERILNSKANQKITATIVWNDPAAQPVATALDPLNLMLVNDLDMRLIAVDGTEYYPWLLDPSTPSVQAIKGDNYRDNVEKLEFGIPEAKPYRLVVSHKGQLINGSQPFSLIVTFKSSLSSVKTLYWVGDSGNWSDNAHWSYSSGGPTASVLPEATDIVIIDENSFDEIGIDQISLSPNASIGALRWLRDSPANLNFMGETLNITKEISVTNESFATIGMGVMRCTTSDSSKGEMFFKDINLGEVHLIVDGGNWTIKGKLIANELELLKGSMTITKSELDLNKLIARSSPIVKEIKIIESAIKINEQCDFNVGNLFIEAESSKIMFENTTAVLNWGDVTFDGDIEIKKSTITIHGNNDIHDLNMNAGSTLTLDAASFLRVKTISKLEGEPNMLATILSQDKATLFVEDHFLLCTDFLGVTNVDVFGTARIYAGVNSTIVNSLNWQEQSCTSALFADFDELYLCQNGFTEFINKSIGEIKTYKWNFQDATGILGTSASENPYFEFATPGPYLVMLTITDSNSSHTAAKEIEIAPSLIEKNEIVVNSNELISLAASPIYQWFLNEEKIEGANTRSYAYQGNNGVYRVVTYDGSCNRSSNLVTITGLESDENQLHIYPNPASIVLNIGGDYTKSSEVALLDAFGKIVFETQMNQELAIPLIGLKNGIYLILIKKYNETIVRRIVVSH